MSIKFKHLDKLYKRSRKITSVYIGDIITEEKLNLYLEGIMPNLSLEEKSNLANIHTSLIHEPYYIFEGVRTEFERNLLTFTDLRQAENYSEYFNKHLSGIKGMIQEDIPWELRRRFASLRADNPVDEIFLGINEFMEGIIRLHTGCLEIYAVFKYKTFKNDDNQIEYIIDTMSKKIPLAEKVDYLELENLSDFFVSKDAYNHVVDLLVKEEYCLPGSLLWIIPNKTDLAKYLWHLKNLGFIRKDIVFSDQTVRYVAEIYFGKKIGDRTSKEGKYKDLVNYFTAYRIHPKINPLEPVSS